MIFCPDNTKHLLLIDNDEEEAKISLKFYHGAGIDLDDILNRIKQERAEDLPKATFMEIWSKSHLRKGTIIGVVAMLAGVFSGIFAITYFLTSFLQSAGLSKSASGLGSAAIFSVGLFAVLITMFKIDSSGRCPLFLISELITILGVSVFATLTVIYKADGIAWTKYASLVAIVVFFAAFVVGPGTILFFITSQLVPQPCHSLAASISFSPQIIASLVVTFLILPLQRAISGYAFFVLFTIPSCLCTLYYLYFAMPETKFEKDV